MKYSVGTKFIAILLCACALMSVAFAGIGIAFMEVYDLYHTSLETVLQRQVDSIGNQLAWHHAEETATRILSNAPSEVLDRKNHYNEGRYYGQYTVEVYEAGKVINTEGTVDEEIRWIYETTIRPSYPVVTSQYYLDENGEKVESAADEANSGIAPASMDPMDEALARVANQEILYSEEFYTGYTYDKGTGIGYDKVYTINYYEGPEYLVRVKLTEKLLMSPDYMLVTVLYPYRNQFIPALLIALAVFAVLLVFLCTVAGRTKNGEVKLAAINRFPLDLYLVVQVGLAVLLFMPVVLLFESAAYGGSDSIWDNPQLCLLICCLCGFGMGLCIIGFLYAFAAQVKASNNYWLRHTVIGWTLRQSKWVIFWALKLLKGILLWALGGFRILGRGLKLLGRGIRAVFIMLPVIWQWLVTAAGMAAVPGFALLFAANSYGFGETFWVLVFVFALMADIAIVCYGGWCFGKLLRGIKFMCEGNLNHQIETKYLYGSFKDFANQLNNLAGAAKLAAEREMKAERMRTDLITNVSHDIKTPLTSIINFVDLMKKPHTEEEGAEYLAVLDRQSQRLKKLIDDLMDMSKASSGTMTVELTEVDAVEAVNQALGEFADKLDRVNLTPVFRHPEHRVMVTADGKLLWRVLSNLLNNAVKYALPGTRLYIDLLVLQDNAVLSIKNISREQLNVNAEELMERFVRGDESRNTEGSGLGLNIAKSLVELQKGQMHLMVDGDLFKVTLIFPRS